MMKQITLFVALLLVPVLLTEVPLVNLGQSAYAEEDEKKTRRVPAMRERTYKALSEAQVLIDPDSIPVEEGEERPVIQADPQAAIALLNDLRGRRGLNPYELAQIWNTLAFAYYTIGDTAGTINSYEQVLNQELITEALELAALRALFQLFFQAEEYRKSVQYMDRWMELKGQPDAGITFLKATAYYQLSEFRDSLVWALETEKIALAEQKTVKENWWYLQVVLYNELKDYDNVIAVLEKLIVTYPKKQYWMHLAGMYAEKGWDDKALSAYYAAYSQKLLTREGEVVMLSQRLLNAEVPYEAARILEEGFESELVERTEKNLRLLAQSYTMAREMGKAIEAWRDATKFAEDGELHYRLAQALANEDRHKEAVEAYEKALDRGELKDQHDVEFWLGISLMQIESWDQATKAFRNASKDKGKAKQCRQYIRYIAGEKRRLEELKKMLES